MVTREEVADLLSQFSGYLNPMGELDPWFTVEEVKQQFIFDLEDGDLLTWLDEWEDDGVVETEVQEGEQVWRWIGDPS